MDLINHLMSAVLMLITFAIGSSLRFSDFENIFKKSKAFNIGLIAQMVFLPILAFLIAYFADLSPELKVGLIIVAICPGGTTSNFISYLVNADTALAVALTTINSILILLTIPTLANVAISLFMGTSSEFSLSMADTFWEVSKITIIPAFLGLVFNRYFPDVTARIKIPLKIINTILLGLVFMIKFFADTESGGTGIVLDEILRIFPYALVMHLSSMILSYVVSKKVFHITNMQSATIGIEVGLQNTVLAIYVAGLIQSVEMAKPALVFAMFSFFTTLIFAFIVMRAKYNR
ncbi:bile acid:sodium symporter family protein [Capnocytophaga stomatis]|uniref:bile acid:sodium symporter family protein n=1 Tax=Capnocytophaga stomatis TaxID=1848904 RepID=UPI00385EE5C8